MAAEEDRGATTIRAVERAVELLQCLNRQPVSTLDLLHRQTGLPKPSLVRLLQTLIAKGLVKHAPQYGAYYITSEVRTLSCGFHSEPRIIEAAAPVADALTAEFKWPVALAILDSDAVVVRYSTIPQSPLALLHSSLNMRLSLVSRALGRAYLAFCPPDEQAVLIEMLAHSEHPEDRFVHDRDWMQRTLAETQARGYALRNPTVRPVSNTLALPVHEHGHVVATLGCTWFASVLSEEQAVHSLLPALRDAARQIGQRLEQMPGEEAPAVPAGRRRRAVAADTRARPASRKRTRSG